MDSRGAPYVRRITNGLVRIDGFGVRRLLQWLRLTGGVPGHAGKDSIAHILHIKHRFPDIYAATYKFLEPKDYLNLRLTGRFAASGDSITLHWLTDNRDVDHIRYDDRLFRLAGVEREKFPELKRAVDVLGPLKPEVAADLGLAEGTRVVMGTPDIHSAAVGSGGVAPFEGHLYIGSSSWLACHVPLKKTDVLHHIAALPSALPGSYLAIGEQETSGACLAFLRDNILYHKDELLAETDLPDVYKIFDRIVERVPAGSDGLIFAPWLYGERCPVDDRHVRGSLHNVSLRTTREHLVRAVFEGVACNARWMLELMERFVRRPFEKLRIAGGGANSDVWCQIHADVFDRTVEQVADPILVNVRGAGLLAWVALGHLSVDEISQRVPVRHTYTPNPDHRDLYDALFSELVGIYERDKKLYERLNREG
jgi:xylulokinase